MGITGNELADTQAKLGSSPPILTYSRPALSYIRRIARQKPKDCFVQWWEAAAPQSYRDLKIGIDNNPKELCLPLSILHHKVAARTRHGDFTATTPGFTQIARELGHHALVVSKKLLSIYSIVERYQQANVLDWGPSIRRLYASY